MGLRGNNKPKGQWRKTAWKHLTPSERKIASIRKEIAIMVSEGTPILEARKIMNERHGHDWRERGLVSNSDNQWTEEELKNFK
jgi:type II secretory pathway component PulF